MTSTTEFMLYKASAINNTCTMILGYLGDFEGLACCVLSSRGNPRQPASRRHLNQHPVISWRHGSVLYPGMFRCARRMNSDILIKTFLMMIWDVYWTIATEVVLHCEAMYSLV